MIRAVQELSQDSLGRVQRQDISWKLRRVRSARVPVVESDADDQVASRLQHGVAADEAAHLSLGAGHHLAYLGRARAGAAEQYDAEVLLGPGALLRVALPLLEQTKLYFCGLQHSQ